MPYASLVQLFDTKGEGWSTSFTGFHMAEALAWPRPNQISHLSISSSETESELSSVCC